nr:MAG TPA: homing endonuclease [Caudoviricetes sp.]
MTLKTAFIIHFKNEIIMDEIWKDIEGYEGLYQVSNLGRVKSLSNLKTKREKILVPIKNKGYFYVRLFRSGKSKRVYVHTLAASAFIPNPYNYTIINHRDENGQNNNVDNLEWCTHKYNLNYGTVKQRISFRLLERNSTRSKQVTQFDLSGNFIRTYISVHEAEKETGISSSSIRKCCKGGYIHSKYKKWYRLTHAGGYIWKYKE